MIKLYNNTKYDTLDSKYREISDKIVSTHLLRENRYQSSPRRHKLMLSMVWETRKHLNGYYNYLLENAHTLNAKRLKLLKEGLVCFSGKHLASIHETFYVKTPQHFKVDLISLMSFANCVKSVIGVYNFKTKEIERGKQSSKYHFVRNTPTHLEARFDENTWK